MATKGLQVPESLEPVVPVGWVRRASAVPLPSSLSSMRADKSAWSGFGRAEPGPKGEPQGRGGQTHHCDGIPVTGGQDAQETSGKSESSEEMRVLPTLRVDSRDALLLQAIQQGLPLASRPYAELGRQTGLSEAEVIARLQHWIGAGLIKRLGVVVRHRQLGYRANAMVVFDVADERVADTGKRLAAFACVTLCYRRPRRANWPYNLFCMVHGKDRGKVEAQVEMLAVAADLADAPRAVLFSRRCFKQRGALYVRVGDATK